MTAVDLSDKSLELAKQRAEVYGLKNKIAFYQANAEELTTYVPAEVYDPCTLLALSTYASSSTGD